MTIDRQQRTLVLFTMAVIGAFLVGLTVGFKLKQANLGHHTHQYGNQINWKGN